MPGGTMHVNMGPIELGIRVEAAFPCDSEEE